MKEKPHEEAKEEPRESPYLRDLEIKDDSIGQGSARKSPFAEDPHENSQVKQPEDENRSIDTGSSKGAYVSENPHEDSNVRQSVYEEGSEGRVSRDNYVDPLSDQPHVDELGRKRVYVKKFSAEGGGCPIFSSFSLSTEEERQYESKDEQEARVKERGDYGEYQEDTRKRNEGIRKRQEALEELLKEMRRGEVHVAEMVVRVVVKDVNDNAPVFPNATIYGEVQENGPIDLSAVVVWAWDPDEEEESGHGQVTYSIAKNVMEERSNQAIFAIHPDTGLVTTTICCLDRETTPEYHIQVVAADGGGLKGTGTVVVRLADVNDNSPRLARQLWKAEVDETWGSEDPSNATLLELSTNDPDTSNYFYYRVVERSGWGWEHFGVRTEGSVGQLYAVRNLDFEDPEQRRGFRFLVQVTDRGRGGWSDARHTDSGWVEVTLVGVNDNPPTFPHSHTHINVREDTPPGSLLLTLPAHDPDMTAQQTIHYHVTGGWGALRVESGGGVRLWRALDREAAGGDVGVARITATDDGCPPLSSTTTLTITVSDVNDCPPRLRPPTLLHVTEGVSARLLGVITATDDDLWQFGHGPPFSFTLAATNPAFVTSIISIKYDRELDSGRGGAEIWSRAAVDREEHRQLTVDVLVGDAGGLKATQLITIIIDDINDNPMKPGAKTVHLWKTQGSGTEVGLGRVYVDDPDDWDLEDKTFTWAGHPHPQFTLNTATGQIYASTQLRESRYELQFLVSDRTWSQRDVSANVTVEVRHLSPEALSHAVPISLSPSTPTSLATDWTPEAGGGGLGTLTKAVEEVMEGVGGPRVEIVSVYGSLPPPSQPLPTLPDSHPHPHSTPAHPSPPPTPYTCVWVSVRHKGGKFLNPIKLHGLLSVNVQKLEEVMKLSVAVDDAQGNSWEPGGGASGGASGGRFHASPDTHSPYSDSRSSVASLASVILPLQVVDTNITSLVTPRLTRAHTCRPHTHYHPTCTPSSCVNGGRCIRTDMGHRCVCPGGSWGVQCKVLSRTFLGAGFTWVRPLPPCLPTTLSVRLLPRTSDGLVLYSGPLSASVTHRSPHPTPMLALQVVRGRAQVVLEGAGGPMFLEVKSTLELRTWHTLHLHLNEQGVTLMVDMCAQGWEGEEPVSDSHCVARGAWVGVEAPKRWGGSGPLQLGGLAHPPPQPGTHGWTTALQAQGLNGCLSHLTVNGELQDLGEPAYSSGSAGGCEPQEKACGGARLSCGLRGSCVGGLKNPRCECRPGFSGRGCDTPTVPASLGTSSFARLPIHQPPDPHNVNLQLRVRSRGRPDGLLVAVLPRHEAPALRLHLRGGVACASVSTRAWLVSEACLDGFPLADGLWHTLYLSRHRHNIVISADDGDGWQRNESLPSLLTTQSLGQIYSFVDGPPVRLEVESEEGVMVGGEAEFEKLKLVAIHDDLSDTCIDDLRVAGELVTFPSPANSSEWGRVTLMHNVETGCPSLDPCATTTCIPPLTCHNTWRQAVCSCGAGRQLTGKVCQDVDECVFQPCLSGGTCYNLQPGYHCSCPDTHTGPNCEWLKLPLDANPLTAPLAVSALIISVLLLVVVAVVVRVGLQRWRACRGSHTNRNLADTSLTLHALTDVSQSTTVSKCLISPGELHPVTEEGALCEVSFAIPTNQTKMLTDRADDGKHKPSQSVSVSVDDATQPEKPGVKQMVCCMEKVSGAAGDRLHKPTQSVSASVDDAAKPGKSGASSSTVTHTSTASKRVKPVPPLIPQDDLRAYAYEGDCSPAGSLSSTNHGGNSESGDEDNIQPLVPEYGEVYDLLKNLSDADNSSPSLEPGEHPG